MTGPPQSSEQAVDAEAQRMQQQQQQQQQQQSEPQQQAPSKLFLCTGLVLGVIYISCSAGMIAFNKYLMQPGRFPYPVHLVTLHTGSGFVMCGLLYLVRPSWFPSMIGQDTHMPVKTSLLWKILPISFLSVMYLILSNWAFMHASVAFLQMMKESNVAFVFLFSVVAGLEYFSLMKAQILFVILFATAMTIRGEIHFSMLGFGIQGSSQMFESVRIVLQALLLANAGKKLDPLSYTFITTPFSFMLLASGVAADAYMSQVNFPSPTMEEIHTWAPVLLANLLLAFSLNLVVTFFIQHTSAVACVLAGIVKDAAIVIAGCLAFGETLSNLQVFGFSLQLATITVWGMMKLFSKDFEDGFGTGFQRVLLRCFANWWCRVSGLDEEFVLAKLEQWRMSNDICAAKKPLGGLSYGALPTEEDEVAKNQ